MMDDVKQVQLCLSGEKQLSVEEARGLFVEVSEELISRFNSDEKIRPYLHDFPVTVENIKVSLSLGSISSQDFERGQIAYMFVAKQGQLFYQGYNRETEKYYNIHMEPYAEAVSIVKGK